MAVPTFELGIALADDPANSLLQIRLFSNPEPEGGFDNLNDFVEVNYPDYAGSRPTDWYAADCIDEKHVYRKSKKIDFRATTASPGKGAWGFFVTMLVGGVAKLMHYEVFQQFVPLAVPNANIVVEVALEVYDVAFVGA